jgi:hypothetical protein
MALDFITLGKIIFKDKEKYDVITDDDKERNFFILNRKFAYNDIKKAKFFNDKNLDKASSLDIWFSVFSKTTNTPQWYFNAKLSKKNKIKSKFKNDEISDIKDRYNFSDSDMDFLILYYEDELKATIKRLKKFKK